MDIGFWRLGVHEHVILKAPNPLIETGSLDLEPCPKLLIQNHPIGNIGGFVLRSSDTDKLCRTQSITTRDSYGGA